MVTLNNTEARLAAAQRDEEDALLLYLSRLVSGVDANRCRCCPHVYEYTSDYMTVSVAVAVSVSVTVTVWLCFCASACAHT